MAGIAGASPPVGVSRVVATGKDLVALLRDLALFLVAVSLFAFPQVLNQRLEQAGFVKGTIAGFEWQAGLERSQEALNDANQAIHNLQEQNGVLTTALRTVNDQLNDPALSARLERVQEQSELSARAADATQAAVRRTIASNAPLVQEAREATGRDGPWYVVYGGDPSLAGAQDEVSIVERQGGISGSRIILRQGSYRSVVPVETREQAQQLLAQARGRRSDAYLVRQSSWCGRLEPRDGYLECIGA